MNCPQSVAGIGAGILALESPDANSAFKLQPQQVLSQDIPDARSNDLTDHQQGNFLIHQNNKPVVGDERWHVNDTELKIRPKPIHPSSNLFRLFVKNGEYVYARSTDIVMMESCDHLVKVYLLLEEKIKKTIRHNTLKDFLSQLPPEQFMRIGRFCAINLQRLSGGNFNEQSFEFDFKVSVKLKHAIPSTVFNSIGK